MKKRMSRVNELIENWVEESSIAGEIDTNGNTRREDCEDIKEWMNNPRVIGKHAKRTQIFLQCKQQ